MKHLDNVDPVGYRYFSKTSWDGRDGSVSCHGLHLKCLAQTGVLNVCSSSFMTLFGDEAQLEEAGE